MRFFLLLSSVSALFASTVSAAVLERRSPLKPTVHSSVAISPAGGGTYPRLAIVNGNILSVFTAFSGSTRTLTVTRSTDGGSTWSALGTIAQGTGDLDNPFLLQLPNGHIVATFRNHDLNSAGAYTYYR